MSFWAELQRRKVFRAAAFYAAVAWLLIQVAATVFPQLNLPDWAPTLVTVFLLAGFPVALVLAWAFELTPDGFRRTPADRGTEQSATTARGRWLDLALLAGVTILAGAAVWYRFSATPGETPFVAETRASGASIAVLPFADMSATGDQTWFGDGIAEQVLDALTRLDGLRVAGRTSSFTFRDSEETLPAIGAALNVATVLEGSVRRDDNRVRVTAQLINVTDGYHLWSQTWDEEFDDIFTIQEQIATSVAGALGVRLGVGGVNRFQGAGTDNIEAYEAYLKGIWGDMRGDLDTALRWLDRAIELDPDYAAAWSQRGLSTASQMWRVPVSDAAAKRDEAFGYVTRALELDPTSAMSHSLYGTIRYARYEWIEARAAHRRAIVLWPNRLHLNQYGNLLFRAGRLSAARHEYEAAEAAEPLGGEPAYLHFNASLAQGHYEDARRMSEFSGPEGRTYNEYLIRLNEGDPGALRDALGAVAALPGGNPLGRDLMREAHRLFDDPPAARAMLRALFADETRDWPGKMADIALLAAWFDDSELAMAGMDIEVRGTVVRMGALWYPLMAEVRRLPAFKQLVTDIHLVDFWRAHGWADQCREVGSEDFTCS